MTKKPHRRNLSTLARRECPALGCPLTEAGKTFQPVRENHKYCSHTCAAYERMRKMRARDRVERALMGEAEK
jgi:hypothetical protein